MLARARKKPGSLWPYVILIGILLPILAVLQYNWLSQMGEAERARMRASLGYGSFFSADQVDRMVAQVYGTFDVSFRDREEAMDALVDSFDRWHAEHQDPQLVGSVYWVEQLNNGGWNVFQYVPDQGFIDVTSPLKRVDIIPRADLRVTGGLNCSEKPALIIPALYHESFEQPEPEVSQRYSIVAFDDDYLFNVYLPTLLRFYFDLEEPDTYRAAIVDASDRNRFLLGDRGLVNGNWDMGVNFFGLTAREQIRLGYNRSMFSGNIVERVAAAEEFFKESSREDRETEGGTVWGEGCWTLVASHRTGTLDAVVARIRHRNLVISSSILLLLTISIITVAVSSQRERKLAAQQMEFVAGVSHELRTPLAVIRSAGENLADDVVGEPDKVKKYGAIIRNEGQRLTGMVENVLQVSRIQPGQNEYDLRPIELLTCIDSALEACRRHLEKSNSTVELRVDETLPKVLADPVALESALQNLIANAAKHGKPGQVISISAQKDTVASGEVVQIEVADQGPGIPGNELAHLFEPFFRGDRARDEQIAGSGLGLSVVRQVIEGHGGAIRVASQAGKGTTFTVTLPLTTEDA